MCKETFQCFRRVRIQ